MVIVRYISFNRRSEKELCLLKKIIKIASKKPIIFNFLRKIIEFNFITIKKVIRKEFSLNKFNNDKKIILDVPCGTGEFCGLFSNSSYIGIDISKEYIEYAKKTYKRAFYCRDARKSGFDNFCFDYILVLGLLHHLDISSIASVFEEIKRILKKDGRVLLIEDAPITSKWNFIGKFLQRYDVGNNIRPAEEYEEVIEKYFVIDKYYPIRNGFWNYSVFALSSK